jgi:regulator of protease activity HflC (stomatin/prohibitin superfamily)
MNKIHLLLVLAGILFITPIAISQDQAGSGTSNDDLALLRQDVQSQKKQIIASNLKLTDAEAVKFWPIYDQYSAEMGKLNDKRLALVKEYAGAYPNVPDNLAQSIVSRWLETDQAAAGVRSKYMPMIEKVLPGKTMARFFQIDRRLGILVDVQVTSEIPLVP